MSKVYSMVEIPDLQIDACIINDKHDLVFLSVWGRDTAIQEFLGRAILGDKSEHGLSRFHIQLDYSSKVVYLGDVKQLEKEKQKISQRSMFGVLTHLWVYSKACVHADKATHRATYLSINFDQTDKALSRKELWPLVKDTCPLPLLDHWQDDVLRILNDNHMIKSLTTVVGDVMAWDIALDLPKLQSSISDMIKSDQLTTTP
ncbi:hypothetical protein DKL61_08190 [Gammaproteobacteria bacterium ESL0073]|nr:hypothetical protein DKL61_08190 [Gammaproteobacteria bacterium ESL0073]